MCVGMHVDYSIIQHQSENINIYFNLKLLLYETPVSLLYNNLLSDVCIMQVLTILNIRSIVFADCELITGASHKPFTREAGRAISSLMVDHY